MTVLLIKVSAIFSVLLFTGLCLACYFSLKTNWLSVVTDLKDVFRGKITHFDYHFPEEQQF